MAKKIEQKIFDEERSLYNLSGAHLIGCKFEGPQDGESPLKQCKNLCLTDCDFSLRYPLWHNRNTQMEGCTFTNLSRAPMWYGKGLSIALSDIYSVKAVRECKRVSVKNCKILSDEFCWKCSDVNLQNAAIESGYAFFESKNIKADNLNFKGKYSFQYVKGAHITNSKIDTKDAFWHAEDTTLENCEVIGEYLGWYSKNLTLLNCKITGRQPLCYCKDLKLVHCTMEGCDLAFEYSDVQAEIEGDILSVKNVKSGHVTAGHIGEIIKTKDSVYPANADIMTK